MRKNTGTVTEIPEIPVCPGPNGVTGISVTVPVFFLLTLAVQTGVEVRGQGVAVPKRPPRQAPAPKLDIPLPKVHFEDVASKAGLAARHVTGQEREKRYILETVGSGVAIGNVKGEAGGADRGQIDGRHRCDFGQGQRVAADAAA